MPKAEASRRPWSRRGSAARVPLSEESNESIMQDLKRKPSQNQLAPADEALGDPKTFLRSLRRMSRDPSQFPFFRLINELITMPVEVKMAE